MHGTNPIPSNESDWLNPQLYGYGAGGIPSAEKRISLDGRNFDRKGVDRL
jgi:hypothetical protein